MNAESVVWLVTFIAIVLVVPVALAVGTSAFPAAILLPPVILGCGILARWAVTRSRGRREGEAE